jgi:hypothetical protein
MMYLGLKKPMKYYVLKTPLVDGYLNDETIELGSIPFVQACRQQSTTPKLMIIEKSAALTKKVCCRCTQNGLHSLGLGKTN